MFDPSQESFHFSGSWFVPGNLNGFLTTERVLLRLWPLTCGCFIPEDVNRSLEKARKSEETIGFLCSQPTTGLAALQCLGQGAQPGRHGRCKKVHPILQGR